MLLSDLKNHIHDYLKCYANGFTIPGQNKLNIILSNVDYLNIPLKEIFEYNIGLEKSFRFNFDYESVKFRNIGVHNAMITDAYILRGFKVDPECCIILTRFNQPQNIHNRVLTENERIIKDIIE